MTTNAILKQKTNKTERIHSFDALRAVMMLLGLVLHSALTYNVSDHGDGWGLKDPVSTHIFSDFIVFIIHYFRMPVFFFVAGFFGAMLFYDRTPMLMIKNRIRRIGYPFVVFLLFLWPITLFSFTYTNAVFSQAENPLGIALAEFTELSAFLPKKTLHLWFLYYLMLITGTIVIIAILLKKQEKLKINITKIADTIIQKPLLRIMFIATVMFVILSILGTGMIDVSLEFIPEIKTFVYFSFFYLTGWILFKSKRYLDTLMRYDWSFVVAAIILTVIQGSIIQKSGIAPNSNSIIMIAFSSIIVSLYLFGITGLFMRYGSKNSSTMRYISDASYWVYLIHFPFVITIPAFIFKLPLGALVKFVIVLSISTTICFLSYHYLVRNTFIGKFLNGRKYPHRK